MMFVFQPKAIAHIFFHEPKAIMIADRIFGDHWIK